MAPHDESEGEVPANDADIHLLLDEATANLGQERHRIRLLVHVANEIDQTVSELGVNREDSIENFGKFVDPVLIVGVLYDACEGAFSSMVVTKPVFDQLNCMTCTLPSAFSGLASELVAGLRDQGRSGKGDRIYHDHDVTP